MFQDLFDIVLSTAENAFLQVGVFVGAVLLLFGFINYKRQGKFVESLERNKPWQPVFGSLLGLSPGCGGAIFVMPLYLKRTVSFGTVIATLIATMGDSAFVLISTHPMEYLVVSVVSLGVAIITGYVVDKLQIDKGFQKRRQKLEQSLAPIKAEHQHLEEELVEAGLHKKHMQHIAHQEGDMVDLVFHHGGQGLMSLPTNMPTKSFGHWWCWVLFPV